MATKIYALAAFGALWVCMTTENAWLFTSIATLGVIIGVACLYSGFNQENVRRAAVVFLVVGTLVAVRSVVPVESVYRTTQGTELITRTFFTGKVISIRKIGD